MTNVNVFYTEVFVYHNLIRNSIFTQYQNLCVKILEVIVVMAVATEKISTNDSISSLNSKICGVCGDKALGYNFNAVTCESCKAFFRRNALTTKEFRCPFNEQCEITVITRRFCQKCRLEKCFSIGMKKEYIMSEEDKVLKRKKIEQNRAKKRSAALEDNINCKIKRESSTNSDESNDGYKKLNGHVDTDVICHNKKNEIVDKQSRDSHNNVSVIISSSTLENVPFTEESKCDYVLNNSSDGYKNSIHANNVSEVSSSQAINSLSRSYRIVENSPETLPNGDTMIRTILNPRLNGVTSFNMDEAPLLSELINTNESHCRNQRSHRLSTEEEVTTPADVTRDVLQDVQRIPIEPNSIESILCEAIKLEYEAYTSIAQAHAAGSSRELNDAERAKLNELIVANKALLQPLDEDITALVAEDCRFKRSTRPTPSGTDPVLLDIINLTAIAIRRLIKMAKKINAFKNMCQEDQVALLKGGCTEMMILRSAMTYDHTKDSWRIPHSQESMSRIKVDVLKQAKGNIYHEHERFIKTFDPRWRMDENIILIMCAITLFTPERPRVIHHDVIKLEQNSYYYLLRRYLESVYQGCEARSTFLKLIQKISELHKLNDEVINVYLDVNPSDVEPLLIEIFDLKPH